MQAVKLVHFFVGERELKDIEVLFEVLHRGGFGDRRDFMLDKPTQDDLRCRFFVFDTEFLEKRV